MGADELSFHAALTPLLTPLFLVVVCLCTLPHQISGDHKIQFHEFINYLKNTGAICVPLPKA